MHLWASNSPATGCTCVFLCVWDVGCATANRRSRFNQLTNRSVWFSSRSYASLLGKTTSVFSHFKNRHAEVRSWKRAPGWWKKKKRNAHQEKCYTEQFLCVIVQSTQSAKHVKCSTCFSSWDFSVAHGRMYDVEQCIDSKRHINKGKAIGSTLKISH